MSLARRRISDWAVATLCWGTAILVTSTLCWIVGDVVARGAPGISWSFLFDAPQDAGRSGGIGPMVVATLWILAVCLLVSVPIGLGTAAFLSEFTDAERGFGLAVRRSLDVLSGVPSIVFGLFGNALFCVTLGLGYSILSGGLTLACMILPLLIRTTEEGFRAIPDEHRRAAAALGLSKSSTFLKILLPLAVPYLSVGLVLGIGRALAETAALLFTSGVVDRMPSSWWDSGRALSIHIYTLAMEVPGGDHVANTTALVLVAMLIVINLGAAFLSSGLLRRRWVTA